MHDRFGLSEMIASAAVTTTAGASLSWDTAETIGTTVASAAGAYLVRLLLSSLRKWWSKKSCH